MAHRPQPHRHPITGDALPLPPFALPPGARALPVGEHFVFLARGDDESRHSGGVVDGDTIDTEVRTPFRTIFQKRLRFYGIDCPETNRTATRAAGLAAKAFTAAWLAEAVTLTETAPWHRRGRFWPLLTQTYLDAEGDDFGRYLALVWRADGRSLTDDLLATGHATVWEG